MKQLLPLLLFAVIVAGDVAAQSQTKSPDRLLPDRPLAYITFVRTGKRETIHVNESNEGVWLRLHNNTRRRMYLRTVEGGPKSQGYLLLYEVVPEDGARTETNLPIGERSDIRTIISVRPGKSALFSVPREHLARGLSISVAFAYRWDGDYEQNLVYFTASNLSAALR